MEIIESLMPIAGSLFALLFAWLVPKLAKLLTDNSDHVAVQVARVAIAELVQAAEQYGLSNTEKRAGVRRQAISALKANGKAEAIKRATGQDLEDFVDTSLEASVYRKGLAAKAAASVGPRSTE